MFLNKFKIWYFKVLVFYFKIWYVFIFWYFKVLDPAVVA